MLRFNIYSPNNEWKYIFKEIFFWFMVCNWLEAIITSKQYAWHTTFHTFLYLYFSLKALTLMLFKGNYCLPLNITEKLTIHMKHIIYLPDWFWRFKVSFLFLDTIYVCSQLACIEAANQCSARKLRQEVLPNSSEATVILRYMVSKKRKDTLNLQNQSGR